MDAAINSGNSGGPVYNANGEVIGVATAKYSSSGSDATVEGLGFAIPSDDAKKISNDLMTNGYVTGKAKMGVSIDQNYSSTVAQYYDMPEGAYVKYVETGSAAEKAGIQPGDIITKCGDKTIEGYEDLTNAIKSYSAGDTVEITVYRSGNESTLSITFDEANATQQQAATQPTAPQQMAQQVAQQMGIKPQQPGFGDKAKVWMYEHPKMTLALAAGAGAGTFALARWGYSKVFGGDPEFSEDDAAALGEIQDTLLG
jgi:serine protease Do